MMNIKKLCKRLIPRAPCFTRNYHEKVKRASTVWESTIPFKAPITSGRVIKVYDGDTITIASKLPYKKSPLYRWSIRIRGIDCPEMKTKNEEEKEIAKLAQEKLQHMILNKTVRLENVDNDKYGRVLADVKYGKRDIGKYMVLHRLALPYYGGTKIPPKSWKKYHAGKEHIDHPKPPKQNEKRKTTSTIKKSHTDHPNKGMKPVYDDSFEVL